MEAKIFDKKFKNYLSQVLDIDIFEKADTLGIQKRDQSYIFDFYNKQIVFDQNDFTDIAGGEVTFAVKTVLCKYIMMCPGKKINSSSKLVTFREFANAGPLFSRFTENTGKIIETTFSMNIEKLEKRCLSLGGAIIQNGSYDLSVRFRALPKVPVIFNFNDKDESFPASAGFLYHDNAENYLDLECLSITCTYLTGLLIQSSV
jgi:hypothetical protein